MQIMSSVVVCHPDAFAAAIAAYRISLQAFRAEFGTAHPGQVYAGVHGTTVGTGLGLFVHDRISFLFSFAHVFDYACINLTNTDTIEFRVFRGTLKYNTVIATLQFVANLCRVAISLPEYRIQEFSWPALIEALTQDNCPELVQYLKERNLYVNEPVTAEREV